jgi:hypothetical protein
VYNGADWDLWARLAVGKTFFETGHVIKHDYLAYTPTKAIWIDHEWGSGVIFYFIMRHLGSFGLAFLTVILVFLTIFIVSKILVLQNPKNEKNYNILWYLLTYLAIFTNVNSLRCQLFTFLFFSLWVYLLERVRRGEKKLLWILPFSMLIWANVHGGFVSGFGLLLIYTIGEFLNKKEWKQYLLILIPVSLTILINPYGFEYIKYLYHAVIMPRPLISEWANSFTGWSWKQFFWYKLFVFVGIISALYELCSKKFKLREIDITKYLLFAVTLYLSIKHAKHQTFYGIITASFFYHNYYEFLDYLKSILGTKVKKIIDKTNFVKEGTIYFLLISCGLIFIFNKPLEVVVPINSYPVDSIEFIKQNKIKGNLYTLFHWGSYTAWKLYPQNLIAIDGRYEEVFDTKLFDETINILENKKTWGDFFEKYKTDVIIMPHTAVKAHNSLVFDKNWRQVFVGNNSTVFVRKEIAKKQKSYAYIPKTPEYFNKTEFYTHITLLDNKS